MSRFFTPTLLLAALVQLLNRAKAGEPMPDNDGGVCYNALMILGMHDTYPLYPTLNNLYEDWPGHSGNREFPIEGSQIAFGASTNKWAGRDGVLRVSMLEHCIKKLTQQIEDDALLAKLAEPVTPAGQVLARDYRPTHGGYPDAKPVRVMCEPMYWLAEYKDRNTGEWHQGCFLASMFNSNSKWQFSSREDAERYVNRRQKDCPYAGWRVRGVY